MPLHGQTAVLTGSGINFNLYHHVESKISYFTEQLCVGSVHKCNYHYASVACLNEHPVIMQCCR